MFFRQGLVLVLLWGGWLTSAAQVFSQEVVLRRNFRPDPMQLQGTASGKESLAALAGRSSGCRGFAQSQPGHLVTLGDTFPLLDILAYTPELNRDLTMLIKGPGGSVWCADDEYQGRSPRISARMGKGTYQIWIGSGEANVAIPYTLSFSETPHK